MKINFPALAAIILLSSCQKDLSLKEAAIDATVSSEATVANEFSNCKLRRIYQSYGEGYTNATAVFTYDYRGNPVSVLFEPYGNGQNYFDYDKNGRLVSYRFFSDYTGTLKHVYVYDANNRIIRDSLIRGSDDYIADIFVSTFTYDAQGRIVKENIRNTYNGLNDQGVRPPLAPARNPTYTYDARGNLGVAGWKSSSYDNKVSIFRSHPIFQFIHRNYSQNNSSVQAKYNSKGLPLTVVPGNDTFFALPNVNKAIYDCQ
jgi:hypothetical protein